MKRNHKIVAAVLMMGCGAALIGWNLRDPDAAYREQPKTEKVITAQEVPAPVQAVITRLTGAGAGGGQTLHEIQEEHRGSEVKYELKMISGDTKTDYKVAPDGTMLSQKSKKIKH